MLKGLMIAAAAVVLSGCIVHGHGPHGAVVVGPGHVHSHTCGHYHSRGHWYHHEGHVHGDGCGHQYRSGIWISID